jgi:hypothetical protein
MERKYQVFTIQHGKAAPTDAEVRLAHLRHEDIVNDFFRCFPAPKCLLVNIGVGESGCSVNLPS